MNSFRLTKHNKYPFIIKNKKDENIVTIKHDGSVELIGNPNDGAKQFWRCFEQIFNEAVQAHVAGKLEEFNKDIQNSLDGEAQTK